MIQYLGLDSLYEAFSSPLSEKIYALSQREDLIGTTYKVILIAKKIFVITALMSFGTFLSAVTITTFTNAQPIALFMVAFISSTFASFSYRAIRDQVPLVKDIFI